MNFNALKDSIVKTASMVGLKTKKHSPEILLVTGIIGIVGGTIMACKASTKVEDTIKENRKDIETLKLGYEDYKKDYLGKVDEETHDLFIRDYRRDLFNSYLHSGLNLVKLYGPAVVMEVGGIICILCSYNIINKRNIALIAAYEAVQGSFNKYRDRVIKEFGEDIDKKFRYGMDEQILDKIVVDKDGNSKVEKEEVTTIDMPSDYARFFDETSTEWTKTPEYNLNYLIHQQQWANDMLHARGYLFLNEVYDVLGIPRSQVGQLVGWIDGPEGKDRFVDFHIWDLNNDEKRAFVNGYERSILLDFNVDGVIYDKI